MHGVDKRNVETQFVKECPLLDWPALDNPHNPVRRRSHGVSGARPVDEPYSVIEALTSGLL